MELPYREEIINDLREKLITDLKIITSLTKDQRDPKLRAYIQDGLPVLQAALNAAEEAAKQIEDQAR